MKGCTLVCVLLSLNASTLGAQKARQERMASRVAFESGELGLQSLRTAAAANGRVLRAWVGSGQSVPEHVVTITESGMSVDGSLLLYWEHSWDAHVETAAEKDSVRNYYREVIEEIRTQYGCGRIRTRQLYASCEGTLVPGQSWSRLLAVLDSLGIETLRDEDEVIPPGRAGFDGATLLIEVRRGSSYRSYHHWSPDANSTYEEVRRASAILDLLSTIGLREK